MTFKTSSVLVSSALIFFLIVTVFAYSMNEKFYGVVESEIITEAQPKIDSIYTLSKLAEEGVASAQGKLAQEYYDGIYIKRNDVKAKYWGELGHAKGEPLASIILSRMYFYGEGVKQDRAKAISLMESASKSRLDAKYLLGRMYLDSATENPDYLEKGQKLIKQAADQGFATAQFDYGRMLLSDSFAMQGAQTEAEQLLLINHQQTAARYMAMAVANEHIEASTYMALLFINGIGVNQDREKGLALLESSAKANEKQAIHRLQTQQFDLEL